MLPDGQASPTDGIDLGRTDGFQLCKDVPASVVHTRDAVGLRSRNAVKPVASFFWSRPKLGVKDGPVRGFVVSIRAGNSGGSHASLQLAPDGVMGNQTRVQLRIALVGPGPTLL